MEATQTIVQVSLSQITTFGDSEDDHTSGCQMKWKYGKIDKLQDMPGPYMPVGLGFHKMVELDAIRKSEAGIDPYTTWQLQGIAQNELQSQLDTQDPDGYLDTDMRIIMATRLETIVRKYCDKVRAAYKPSAAPEYPFDLIIDDVLVKGVIDAQTEKAIIDWKCVKSHDAKRWQDGKLIDCTWIDGSNGDHYLQAAIYLMARPEAEQVTFIVFACDPDNPRACECRFYPVKRADLNMEMHRAKIVRIGHEIAAARESGNFVANTSKLCLWCGYFGDCKIGQSWARAAGLEPRVPVRSSADTRERANACPECHASGRITNSLTGSAHTTKGCLPIRSHGMHCTSCGATWMLTAIDGAWQVSHVKGADGERKRSSHIDT